MNSATKAERHHANWEPARRRPVDAHEAVDRRLAELEVIMRDLSDANAEGRQSVVTTKIGEARYTLQQAIEGRATVRSDEPQWTVKGGR